jgi:hypothetical protein
MKGRLGETLGILGTPGRPRRDLVGRRSAVGGRGEDIRRQLAGRASEDGFGLVAKGLEMNV